MRFSTHFRSGGSTFVQLPTREKAFCRPLPSLTSKTCFFDSTDGSFVCIVGNGLAHSVIDGTFVRTVYGMTAGFPAKPQVLWGAGGDIVPYDYRIAVAVCRP